MFFLIESLPITVVLSLLSSLLSVRRRIPNWTVVWQRLSVSWTSRLRVRVRGPRGAGGPRDEEGERIHHSCVGQSQKWSLSPNRRYVAIFPLLHFDVKEILINPKVWYQVTTRWRHNNDRVDISLGWDYKKIESVLMWIATHHVMKVIIWAPVCHQSVSPLVLVWPGQYC